MAERYELIVDEVTGAFPLGISREGRTIFCFFFVGDDSGVVPISLSSLSLPESTIAVVDVLVVEVLVGMIGADLNAIVPINASRTAGGIGSGIGSGIGYKVRTPGIMREY